MYIKTVISVLNFMEILPSVLQRTLVIDHEHHQCCLDCLSKYRHLPYHPNGKCGKCQLQDLVPTFVVQNQH